MALCCKAMLPILGMGHVRLFIDPEDGGSPFRPLIRWMTTHQPSGALHLELVPYHPQKCHVRRLMELRCPYMLSRMVLEHARECPCGADAHIRTSGGTCADAVLC